MTQRKIFIFILIIFSFQLTGCLLFYPVVGTDHRYQPNKGSSEISLSYGRISGTEIVNAMDMGKDISAYEEANTGNLFATYRYYVNNRIGLGVALGTQSMIYDWTNDNSGSHYTQKISMVTTGAEIKCLFADSRYFQFYELLAFAATYRNEIYNNALPSVIMTPQTGFLWNMQWSPIGFRFGNSFGGFLELGIGYKGLINGGISYMMPSHKKQVIKSI